jgi:prepilin signal peptidase PulO-like enzyme (type II secretory pathway)
MYQFTVKYSEAIARAAVRATMIRSIKSKLDWKRQCLLLLTAGGLLFSFAKDGITWLDTAVGSVYLFGFASLVILYRNTVRQAIARLRSMKAPVGKIILTDENITVSTELGSSTLPWSSIEALSEQDGFWLLYVSTTSALTVPVANVEGSTLDFLKQKIATRAMPA